MRIPRHGEHAGSGESPVSAHVYSPIKVTEFCPYFSNRIILPSPGIIFRPLRPPSERLHLWKKVMKVHQDRQLRVCTHAQAQIQCRYAYLPKIGRHQNQTRSAGRSSPPVVDLYRQTHLARSELLRTPRDTSIYQGQFYP